MARTEQTKIEVLLDGRQASDQLKDLSKNAAELRIELAKAYEANDAGKVAETEWELSKLDSRMKQLRKETVNVNAVLDNLSGATMTDLKQSIIAVDAKLNSKKIKRNSEDWKELTEVKRTLIAEQKKLRKEMESTDNSMRKQRLSIADWVVSLGVIERAFSGVKTFLRDSLYSFNDFEKSVKGLSSLTGLTGNDLNYLADQAKNLSTQTLEGGIVIQQSATEITDAYKMIGSQRPELLKNKEALNKVTQEAIILSEAAEMNLEPAAKALTNSLNQFDASADQSRRFINALAAGSQAGAGDINYLSQAIEKSGTTANLMGVQFEELVALVETAAPKFNEAAVAGNSIDKVLMEMKSRQIGYRDGVFDVNLALDELAGRFQKGELAANIFGKEHAKMVEVLVQGREDFRTYQEAVTGTNKAIEQAATNTDTNSARLRQQQNNLEKLRIELGEKLTPLVGTFTSGTSSLIKVLISAIGFFTKYGTAIALVTAAIAAQTVVMKYKISLHSISEKLINKAIVLNKLEAGSVNTLTAAKILLTKGISGATGALKTFFSALTKNPLGLILTGVTLLGVGIYKLATYMSTAEKMAKRLNEIQKEYHRNLIEERTQMDYLFDAVKKSKEGTEARKTAIKLLNDKYGEYLPNLLTEKSTLEEIEVAQRFANDELLRSLTLKAKKSALEDTAKTYMESYEERYNDFIIRITRGKSEEQKQVIESQVNDILGWLKSTKIEFNVDSKTLKATTSEYQDLARKISEFEKNNGKNGTDTKAWMLELLGTTQKMNKELDKQGKYYENITKGLKSQNQGQEAGNDSDDAAKGGVTKVLTKEEQDALDALEKQYKKELEAQNKYREEILFNAKSALEQEDALNEERLRKAGLWGIKEEDLHRQEIQAIIKGNDKEATTLRDKQGVLEALQKTHQANIIRIKNETEKKQADNERKKAEQTSQSIAKELQLKKAGYERELAELRIKHNEELADEALTAEQRKSLKEQHQEKERELTIRQTKDMISYMRDILKDANLGGIDLAGKIFTPEEKENLEAEILKAREALSKLQADGTEKSDTPKADESKASDVDVLGMTPDKWEEFFGNLENGKVGIEDMQSAANALMRVWSMTSDFMAAKEKKQLKQYEKNTKQKKAALDSQLDSGKISQEQYTARVSQLDAELDAKKAEIENKQAKRQKAMAMADVIKNTALAIMRIWADVPKFDFGASTMALTAMVGALGSIQLATIASTPLPGAESGGYIDVVRSQDGKNYKAKNDPSHRGYVDEPTVITGESGREFVMNDRAVSNPTVKPVLDVIDMAQKNGTIDRLNLTQYMQHVLPGRTSGGTIGTESGSNVPVSATMLSTEPEVKKLLQENLRMMQILASKPLEIPWYGRGGINEKMKKAEKFEQEIRIKR